MAGLVTTLGAGAMTNSIREIRQADFLFVIGSNTTEAHPVIGMEIKRAVRRGARLVVADPRSIWLTQIAYRHMQLKPGTDVWLLNAMAHVIVTEDLLDREFIVKHTDGFDSIRETLLVYTPEKAEKITGVPAEMIREVARLYAKTPKAGIYYTLGITEHTHGTDNVYALSNLVLMTGHLGRPSTGLNPLRGQNNVQGANDAGASPIFYPGYQRVDDQDAQVRYERSWGVKLSAQPGLNLNQMMKAVGEEIQGLYVMGEDLVLSEPDVLSLEARLRKLDFLVVQDIFLNATTPFASVVFPAACFAEKDGVFTNSERRVQRVRKAVEPPGKALPDWEILMNLARACGADWAYSHPSEIYDEFVRDTDKFAGICYERIENENGMQWPCPHPDHPGTKYLHAGGPIKGKAIFQKVEYTPPEEETDDKFPLLLSTGRTLYHYNAATQTRKSTGLEEKQSQAFVQMHPDDAHVRNIKNNDFVLVSSRRGKVRCRARITPEVRPGCIWMPFHFIEARANVLTQSAGDSVTGTPAYKVCAAEINGEAG